MARLKETADELRDLNIQMKATDHHEPCTSLEQRVLALSQTRIEDLERLKALVDKFFALKEHQAEKQMEWMSSNKNFKSFLKTSRQEKENLVEEFKKRN